MWEVLRKNNILALALGWAVGEGRGQIWLSLWGWLGGASPLPRQTREREQFRELPVGGLRSSVGEYIITACQDRFGGGEGYGLALALQGQLRPNPPRP